MKPVPQFHQNFMSDSRVMFERVIRGGATSWPLTELQLNRLQSANFDVVDWRTYAHLWTKMWFLCVVPRITVNPLMRAEFDEVDTRLLGIIYLISSRSYVYVRDAELFHGAVHFPSLHLFYQPHLAHEVGVRHEKDRNTICSFICLFYTRPPMFFTSRYEFALIWRNDYYLQRVNATHGSTTYHNSHFPRRRSIGRTKRIIRSHEAGKCVWITLV